MGSVLALVNIPSKNSPSIFSMAQFSVLEEETFQLWLISVDFFPRLGRKQSQDLLLHSKYVKCFLVTGEKGRHCRWNKAIKAKACLSRFELGLALNLDHVEMMSK